MIQKPGCLPEQYATFVLLEQGGRVTRPEILTDLRFCSSISKGLSFLIKPPCKENISYQSSQEVQMNSEGSCSIQDGVLFLLAPWCWVSASIQCSPNRSRCTSWRAFFRGLVHFLVCGCPAFLGDWFSAHQKIVVEKPGRLLLGLAGAYTFV